MTECAVQCVHKFFVQFSIYETLFYLKCFFFYIMKSGVFDDFAGIKVSELYRIRDSSILRSTKSISPKMRRKSFDSY